MATDLNAPKKPKKKFQFPHVFILLSCVILLVAALSYLLPAGTYDTVIDPVSGSEVVDPDSFHYVESTPVTLMQLVASYSNGFQAVAPLLFMTMAVGGTFGVIHRLGIIPAMVSFASKSFRTNRLLAIPILLLCFSALDTFLGMPELCIVFLPIITPLILSLGFDSLTACAVVICGNCVGFSTGLGNPFTTLICQKICGLPLYSGLWYRAICFVVFYGITVVYVMRYALRVAKDPQSSRCFAADQTRRADLKEAVVEKLTLRKKLAAGFIATLFVVNVVGTFLYGWDVPEMTGIFLIMGFGSAVISGTGLSKACLMFVDGCKDILQGALVMCVARTISVVMEQGNITYTIVHGLSEIIAYFPQVFTIVGIFLAVMLIDFFIPAGSGEAVVVMPIISPLAEILGLSKQACVLAFQFGDGWSNTIWPTTASYMATLAVGEIKWTDWQRFQLPLFCIWFVVGALMLMIAQLIGLGPM
ncbi:YfcC family protein [Candidatus Allofournierella excrementavium]|uniref:YfcC family protein n=1 Tax=Candidatus Allofournierella excrementavium TaxID=2838591 RepID=UPI00374FB60D